MVSPESTTPSRRHPAMANKSAVRTPQPSILADGFIFSGGAAVALLLFWALYSFLVPTAETPPTTSSSIFSSPFFVKPSATATAGDSCPDRRHDPPSRTFYDDPNLAYTVGHPIKDWDLKRRRWFDQHPSFEPGAADRILMISGSQSTPCKNPTGDHLLLRFFKNKADYCRIHGIDFFYNTALLHPEMFAYWAKIPAVRAAMIAHPESEWIWWVDSDAAITDMDFKLPLHKYRNHNMVVHGWPRLIYEEKSWTSLNAGVFLIRNCQWSMDFLEIWAATGPQTPEYEKWGKTLKSEFKDKLFPESDDQSALVYLLLKEKEKWGAKIYVESEYYFEGYWVEIVGRLQNMTEKYVAMERRTAAGERLRRRHAEAVAEAHAEAEERRLAAEGLAKSGRGEWRRPFITHFTGCQPCSGDHNKMYSGENCWEGMQRALNFADDQVLRSYGFRHRELAGANSAGVEPLPFDFPVSP